MLDPQENITIGNFLYSLGLSIGVRAGRSAPAGAVNLLQQTSYDKPLGDVMLTYPGVTRLLEFKRKGNLKKERSKLQVLSRAMAGLPHRVSTSHEIHWYVETAPASEGFRFEARPYLNMLEEISPFHSMEKFVDALVDEALAPTHRVSDRLANEYIQDVVLTWCAGSGKRSSTGLLVVVGGTGGLHYVVLDDIADLGRTREACLKLQQERLLQNELEWKRARSLRGDQDLGEISPKERAKDLGHERDRH